LGGVIQLQIVCHKKHNMEMYRMSMSNSSEASKTPNNERRFVDVKYSDSEKSHSRITSNKENRNDSNSKVYK